MQVPAEQQFHTEASWSLECSASSFSCLLQPSPRFSECMALPASPVTAFPLQSAQPPEREKQEKKGEKRGQVSASAGAFPLACGCRQEVMEMMEMMDGARAGSSSSQCWHLSALCRCCLWCCSEGLPCPAACAALQHLAWFGQLQELAWVKGRSVVWPG